MKEPGDKTAAAAETSASPLLHLSRAAAAAAHGHRDALFLAQCTTNWNASAVLGASGGAAQAGVAAQRAWLRETHATPLPYSNGEAYQNYIDPELSDWRAAYYGANYAKLARVKAAYDPERPLRFPQAVGG
jgi:Berberine and berberine like